MKAVTLHPPPDSAVRVHLDSLHKPKSEVPLTLPSRSRLERTTKSIMHTSIGRPPERLAGIKPPHVPTRHLRLCHSSKNLHAGFFFLFKYSLSEKTFPTLFFFSLRMEAFPFSSQWWWKHTWNHSRGQRRDYFHSTLLVAVLKVSPSLPV